MHRIAVITWLLLSLFLLLLPLVSASAEHVDYGDLDAVGGAPERPQYTTPLSFIARVVNSIESVTTVQKSYINRAATKTITNISGAEGWYAQLIRNDLSALFMVYPYQPTSTSPATILKCYAFQLPSGGIPIPPPSIPPVLNFSAVMPYFDARQRIDRVANVWRFNIGSYTVSILTDRLTGKTVSQSNFENMDQQTLVDVFETGGAEPDESVFDVPAECQIPPSADDGRDDNNNGNKNKRFGHDEVDPSAFEYLAARIDRFALHSRSKAAALGYGQFSDAAAALLGTKLSKNVGPNKIIEAVRKLTPAHKIYLPKQKQQRQHSLIKGLPLHQTAAGDGKENEVDYSMYAAPARDQAACGCCHAASTVAATEIIWNRARGARNTGEFMKSITRASSLSFQALIDCARDDPRNGTSLIADKGCFGGWPATDMQSIIDNGIPLETDYPYLGANGASCKLWSPRWNKPLIKPLSDWKMIINSSADMEAAVTEGPVVAVMNTPSSWLFMTDGIYNLPCAPALNHAVTIVGMGVDAKTGQKYWKIKNSFGREWASEGFFKILRGSNTCGIEQFAFVPIPS